MPDNLAEDPVVSKKDLEEEHSRELQIEEAFRLFQRALELQASGLHADAYRAYESLFALDIIANHYFEEEDYIRGLQDGGANEAPDPLSFLPANVKSVRYLVFRNRGFLYLEILRLPEALAQLASDDERFKQLFYTMIDDFVICFVYQEVDEEVLKVLYQIFSYLGLWRLERFTLEYSLSSRAESDDLVGVLPVDPVVVRKMQLFKDKLCSSASGVVDKIEHNMRFLSPIRQDLELQNRKASALNVVEIGLDHADWTTVIDAVNDQLKQSIDKAKALDLARSRVKGIDAYLLTEAPIDRIKFNLRASLLERASPAAELSEEATEAVDDDEDEFFEVREEPASQPVSLQSSPQKAKPQVPRPELPALEPTALTAELAGFGAEDKRKTIQRSSKRLQKAETAVQYIEVEITRDTFRETTKFFEVLNQYLAKVSTTLKLGDVASVYVARGAGNPVFGDFIDALNKWLRLYTSSLLNSSIAKASLGTVKVASGDSVNVAGLIAGEAGIGANPAGPGSSDAATGTKTGATSTASPLNSATANPPAATATLLDSDEVDTEVEKQRLLDVINSFDSKLKSPTPMNANVAELSEVESSADIVKFLMSLREQTVDDLRVSVMHKLILSSADGNSLVVATRWSSRLFTQVQQMVTQCEGSILQKWKLSSTFKYADLSFAVGIYEILVDCFMSSKLRMTESYSQSKRRQMKSNRYIFGNLHLEHVRIKDKLKRWRLLLTDMMECAPENNVHMILRYRYKWAATFHEKADADSYDCELISVMLKELLHEIVANGDSDIFIPMPNYSNISEISLESIRARINTTSILSVFSKILNCEGDNNEAKHLLEGILIDEPDDGGLKQEEPDADAHFVASSIQPIRAFLDQSKVDMKLSLWNILFLLYNETNDVSQFQRGFEKLVAFLVPYLANGRYRDNETGFGTTDMIKVVAFLGDYLFIFLEKLQSLPAKWRLGHSKELESTLAKLMVIFELLYLFSLHEEAALLSTTRTSIGKCSVRAYDRFKDMFVHILCLIFLYYREMLQAEEAGKTTHQLLITLHEQLGLRRLCDSGKGYFLTMAQDVLSLLNQQPAVGSCEQDLVQVISCRYHYKLTINNFTPLDHETTRTGTLDLKSAVELSALILPLCFKKNPIFHPPKADMKLIVDDFFDVVGEPNIEKNLLLRQNDQKLEYFLNSSSLTPKFFREAFHGLIDNSFESSLRVYPPESHKNKPPPLSKVVLDGLYYLEGLLIFTSYKIRKKSMQSRAVELETIIKLLKNDLIFGSNRVESWFLLGQAFGFLVEDDLIWTSDKLIFPERKTTTANLQRKALICYLMSINEALRIPKSDEKKRALVKPIFGGILSQFAKELYNACMTPMDMHAFKVLLIPKFVKSTLIPTSGSNNAAGTASNPAKAVPSGTFVPVSSSSLTGKRLCYKLIQQSLHLAINDNKSDWTNYYYLSKVQSKLELLSTLVLGTLLAAVDLATEQLNPVDPIVEPHYRFCSLLYKLVKTDKLSVEDAYNYVQYDSVLATVPTISAGGADDAKRTFYRYIVLCLKRIMTYDKKKWHHKPRYRLAKIEFEEFGKTEEAIEEMSSIVSLKSTSKTLVSIWKPEHERPGKHFHYTFQYALFYIVLLARQQNLVALIQMLPKLRRSNSTMISLYTAWEALCTSICKIVRELLPVSDSFTESFLQRTSYQSFIYHSKSMIEHIKENGMPPNVEVYFCFLHAISDMKKYNNGYGPTSLIDDTIVSVYIILFEIFAKNHNKSETEKDITDSPSGRPKKLAKRDVFPFISDILKNFRREIEDILKMKPDIFNEYVKEALQTIVAKAKAAQEQQEQTQAVVAEKVQTPQPEGSPEAVMVTMGEELAAVAPEQPAQEPKTFADVIVSQSVQLLPPAASTQTVTLPNQDIVPATSQSPTLMADVVYTATHSLKREHPPSVDESNKRAKSD